MALLDIISLPLSTEGVPRAAIILLGLALAYYLLLPSPIPGIPYNRRAALTPLGDIPSLLAHYRRRGRVYDFFSLQCLKHNSPVIQLFLSGKPLVVVSDMREIYDIATRRVHEFDRDDVIIRMFSGFVGKGTITMKTHAAFWEQRKIWNCTMTDQFLHQVAAPNLYESARELVQLWKRKSALCDGVYAFPVAADVRYAVVDALWQIATGASVGTVQSQLQFLRGLDRVQLPSSKNQPVYFPTTDFPPIVHVCKTLLDSVNPNFMNPAPQLLKWLRQHAPSFRKAIRDKVSMLDAAIQKGREKFVGQTTNSIEGASAVDFVIQRESAMAERKDEFGGQPDENFRDELLSLLLGGLETSVTTMTWGLKYLTDDPGFQNTLRKALRDTFPDYASTSPPPVQEVCRADIPYLDATLHEILRMANTATFVMRQTSVNAKILGHEIPQGTGILFALEADAYLFDEELSVDESVRSTSSRDAGRRWRTWSSTRKQEFNPMRWIRKDEKGNEVFDPQAGPSLPFSAGPRGCAGKKLAMLELKLLVFVLIWEAKLKSVPDHLSSYEVRESFTRAPRQCYVRV